MPLPLRSQVKLALFNVLTASSVTFPQPINGALTWVMKSQRLKLWGNVDSSMQPALFLVQHREGYVRRGSGIPARRYLDVGCWCYAPSGNEALAGDVLIDGMEEAIESALLGAIDNHSGARTTLGGLVYDIQINREDGVFIRDPGDIDGQALLVFPIRILMP